MNFQILLSLSVLLLLGSSCDGFAAISKTNVRHHHHVKVSAAPPARQILEFQEPQTNTTVVLVGAMHYNPTSINLARTTIESLENQQKLGSVIVESCDIRWNKTLALYEKYPLLKQFLKNEMLTSSELAQEFGRPVVLADQRINITSAALKANLKETLIDLTSPPSGWKRFAQDIKQAWDETVPFGGKDYLNAFAFFDPSLLLVLPVSLVKYPFSFLVRSPIPTSIVLLGVLGLNNMESSNAVTMDAITNDQIPLYSWVISFGLSALETIVFARLLLKPLLAERNEILARSILDQCRLLSTTTKETSKGGWLDLLAPKAFNAPRSAATTTEPEIVYAPGSIQTKTVDDDQVVVAVLGMAHCNGIKKLLKEQRV